MPIPYITYASNKEAAQAVYRHITTLPQARHLRLLPRGRARRDWSSADFAEWWFTHSLDWPGYRYGRLFLDRVWGPPQRRLPGLLRAGFTLARGFGRQAADLVPPDLVIDSNWFWYRFLSDSMAGVFDVPLRALLASCRQPVIVDLALTYFDRDPDPGNEIGVRTPNDQLTFAIRDESLTFDVVREGGDILAPLVSATSLRDLVFRLEGVQDLTWYWIDVHICVQAWYQGEHTDDGEAWDATTLWEYALAPWLPWVH